MPKREYKIGEWYEFNPPAEIPGGIHFSRACYTGPFPGRPDTSCFRGVPRLGTTDREEMPFTLRLADTGQEMDITVSEDQSE